MANKDNYFIKNTYCGSDGDNFKIEFINYLENIIANNRWDSMSDHTLFLQGGKIAIKEIVDEIKLLL